MNRNKQVSVMCLTKDNRCSFLHFINKVKDSEDYIDITLGTLGIFKYRYYKMFEYDNNENEYRDMGDRLYLEKNTLLKKVLSKFEYKWFLKIVDIDIII